MMRGVKVGTSTVTVLPVVKGLVSEAEVVSEAFDKVDPPVVAISISREDLRGLRERADYDKYEPSDLEIIYQAFLERFGEVRIPPPAYVRAMEVAEEAGVSVVPVDMNDELYTATYCDMVRTRDMVRESMFARKATGMRFDLSSPQAFARSFDLHVNRSPGYRRLEEARERHIATALRNLGRIHRTILAVIECERSDGVAALLENAEGPSVAPQS